MIKRIYAVMVVFVTALSVIISLYYNFSMLESVLPMTGSLNQHIYQKINEQEESLPDARLRAVVRDKSVYVPYEVKEYTSDNYEILNTEDERTDKFKAVYYRENNYARYFNEYSGACIYDDTLPIMAKVSDYVDTIANDDSFEGFTRVGNTNDLLRYSFMLNKENIKETAYFWYAWFYHSFAVEKNYYSFMYFSDDVDAASELVAVWDKRENLFVMSRDYYETSFIHGGEIADDN